MTTLNFVLSPESVSKIYDALICLSKFSEVVGLEATATKLTLISLNSSRTASATITLEKDHFFTSYNFIPGPSQRGNSTATTASSSITSVASSNRFTCQILNKGLLSIFKPRPADLRGGDTSIERCEVRLDDQADKAGSRLVVRLVCRHGVKKIYKLTYEATDNMRALFDRNTARNKWSINSHVLRQFSEYLGARAENLDIFYDAGRVAFTSYTERIVSGSEILKQPLHTSIAIDTIEFENFRVDEKLHVGISVKDFKAIVNHADSLKVDISALYSDPGRPLQLSYGDHGMKCEVTLMTTGESRSASVTPAPPANANRNKLPTGRGSRGPSVQASRAPSVDMPPPVQPASRSFTRDPGSQRPRRASPPSTRPSVNEQSLFLDDDADADDSKWDEATFDGDQDEGDLRWDSRDPSFQFQRDRAPFVQRPAQNDTAPKETSTRERDEEGVAPTQELSQIQGMFD